MEQKFGDIKKVVDAIGGAMNKLSIVLISFGAVAAINELYIGSLTRLGMSWVYQTIIFVSLVEVALATIYCIGYVALVSTKREMEKSKPESVQMKEFGAYMIKMGEEMEKKENESKGDKKR